MFAAKFVPQFFVLVAVCFVADSKQTEQNDAVNCVANYLKEKGRLRQDFEAPKLSICNIITPLAVKIVKNHFKNRVWKIDFDKTDCLKEAMYKDSNIDVVIKDEFIPLTRGFTEDEAQVELVENRKVFKLLFEKISKDCRSKSTFDELLVVLRKNESSLDSAQEEFCYGKYSVENKLIDVGTLNFNVQDNETPIVDCTALVEKIRLRDLNEITTNLGPLPENQRKCILDSYNSGNGFGINVALEAIADLDIPEDVRIVNYQNLRKKLDPLAASCSEPE